MVTHQMFLKILKNEGYIPLSPLHSFYYMYTCVYVNVFTLLPVSPVTVKLDLESKGIFNNKFDELLLRHALLECFLIILDVTKDFRIVVANFSNNCIYLLLTLKQPICNLFFHK